jgi:hypothetical protein
MPLLGRWGIRTTLAVSMAGTSAGIAALVAGTTPAGGFRTLLPGSVLWGLCGGVAFVTLFASHERPGTRLDRRVDHLASAARRSDQRLFTPRYPRHHPRCLLSHRSSSSSVSGSVAADPPPPQPVSLQINQGHVVVAAGPVDRSY